VDKRYLIVFVVFFGMPLGLMLALNLALGERALGSAEAVRQASAWQHESKGVTYAPPVTHSRPFKALRMADMGQDINTVVLGASSLMGVTQAMFPAPARLYNFSLTANLTPSVTGDALAITRAFPQVRHYVIGLDWAIPALFQEGGVIPIDLAPQTQLAGYASNPVPLAQRIADALSLPRVQNLGRVLRDSMRTRAPVAALRDAFFETAGAPYACVDGTPARDFDIVSRGACLGFRHDGSWTFANEQRLTPARAQVLAQAAAAPSSQFARHLCTAQGEPNAAVLQGLGEFARGVIAGGGQVVFIVPPLVPGMSAEMRKGAATARCHVRVYAALEAWARTHGVVVIDAAPSERYGCVAAEFLDENHAWPECHARVLGKYLALRERGELRPGVYRP
jgi:hypothetical protein